MAEDRGIPLNDAAPASGAAPGAAEAPIRTDVVIVGAGPAACSRSSSSACSACPAHLVDALPQPGGQCIELYPDKPIYDIPALPVCTGRN
jgi:thioredoxin reductase (NADPH)